PLAHGGGDGVGERGLERLALGDRRLELLEHRLGQPLALDGDREDVLAERVGAGLRQVRLSERAAQWSPNGGALGQADLTQPGANTFGENVFSIAVQRQRLPKAVFKQLEATIAKGEPLEPALADAVASAMREWAMERGATHYTHWFQPLTNSTAEKHDSF